MEDLIKGDKRREIVNHGVDFGGFGFLFDFEENDVFYGLGFGLSC